MASTDLSTIRWQALVDCDGALCYVNKRRGNGLSAETLLASL
jgi:hypothetical protein